MKTCWAKLSNYSNNMFLVAYKNDCGAQCMTLKTGRLMFYDDDSLKVTCTRHGLNHVAQAIVRVDEKLLRTVVANNNDCYYDLIDKKYVFIDLKEWSGWTLMDVIFELAPEEVCDF